MSSPVTTLAMLRGARLNPVLPIRFNHSDRFSDFRNPEGLVKRGNLLNQVNLDQLGQM
jgi:hypothetical protein